MDRMASLLSVFAAGAGMMFLLDPDRGARRRALARDQALSIRRRLGETAAATFEDVGNRAFGSVAEARRLLQAEPASDPVIYERVRAALGTVCARPADIDIEVDSGQVTLRGVIADSELARTLRRISWTGGVTEIDNRLTVRPEDETDAGGTSRWTPTDRALAWGVGLATLGYGVIRRVRQTRQASRDA
jgi:hypothetical protein